MPAGSRKGSGARPVTKSLTSTVSPTAIVWLAEAESSLNPSARSPVGAKGLFQSDENAARGEERARVATAAQMRATLGTAPTAREGIRDWLLTGIRPGERHRTLLKIIYADAVQPSLLLDRAATAQSIRDAQVWVREALARGIAAGEFRADMDVARTAHSLQNIHSLLTRQAVADYPLFEVGAHEEASILELLMRGLGTRD